MQIKSCRTYFWNVKIFLKTNKTPLNFVALAAIQGANAVFPIVLFPYFLFVLGPTLFARLVVLEAVALYVLTISLYSFEIIGAQRLIEAKKNSDLAILRVYFETLYTRLSLFLVSAGCLLLIFYVFFPRDFIYIAVWLFFPLGQILQSNYYYQAMEENGINAIVIISSRIIFLVGGYILIKGADDVLIAHALIPMSYFSSGLISVIVVRGQMKEAVVSLDIGLIWQNLKEGWVLFFGGLAVVLYRNTNVLILTAVSGNAIAISAYAMAEKMVKMLQAICTPLNQLFFPRVMLALQLKNANPKSEIWRYTKPQVLAFAAFLPFVSLMAYFDSNYGQLIFNSKTLNVFLIMSSVPIFGIVNFMFGMVGLSVLNKSTLFARGTILAGFSSVALCAVGGHFFDAYGAAVAFLFAEIILFACVMLAINKA